MKKLLPLIIALMSFSCSFDEPYLPAWNTQVTVHFNPYTVEAADLVTSSYLADTLLSGATDTVFFFSVEDSTGPQGIDPAELAFKPEDKSIVETVGLIELDAPAPVSTDTVTLADLFPDLNISAGAVLPPLPQTTLSPPDEVVSFDEFVSITVDSAEMYLVFDNKLILSVEAGMEIILFDEARINDPDSGLIGTILFTDPIPAGGSGTSEKLALNDVTLHNSFRLRYRIPIAAVDTATTLTQEDVDSYFLTTVHMGAMRVSSAEAEIPAQSVTREDVTALDTEDKSLTLARIDKGALYIDINNHLNVGADFDIVLLNLVDENDQPRHIPLAVNENQTSNTSIDLSGLSLRNHARPGDPVTDIAYRLEAVTRASNGAVRISSTDSIEVSVRMDSVYIGYFEGDVGTVELTIDPIEQNDVLDGADIDGSFSFPDVRLVFDFYNEINFPISTSLKISGYVRDAAGGQITDSVTVNVQKTIAAGQSGQPVKTTLVLDANSSAPSIVDLMSIFPTDIVVSGKSVVSGSGSVAADDVIRAKYRIESPLTLQIDQPIRFESSRGEITESDLDADTRGRITRDVSALNMALNIENGWPVGADVTFYLAADSAALFDSTIIDPRQKLIIPLKINAGSVDGDGYVTEETVSSVPVSLDSTQLKIFNNIPLYYGFVTSIAATPQKVTLRKHDALSVDGSIKVKVKVDPNEK